MILRPLTLVAALVLAALPSAQAQAPAGASVESRLREQNKTLTTQVRTLQGEKSTLEADKTALLAKVEESKVAVKTVNDELVDLKKKTAAEADRLRDEIKQKSEELEKEQAEHKKAQDFATASAARVVKLEGERATLVRDNGGLQGVVIDQQNKNSKLLEISRDILDRYSKFGLGTALTAREPFTGITRTRIESMVEDYNKQLAAQGIRVNSKTAGALTVAPKAGGKKATPAKADAKPAPKPAASDRPSDGPAPAAPTGAKPAATKP